MRRTLAVFCTLAVAAMAGAQPAAATHVACGDVITQDTTLDTDLVNCPGDGVVIGAPGITLDLGGRTIDGVLGAGGNGVDNSGGHDRVTVERGRISEFQFGVLAENADDNRVTRVTFVTTGGVHLDHSDRNVVERNTFLQGNGVTVFVGSSDTTIAGNAMSGPGTAVQIWGGEIATPEEVRGTRVERNDLVENGAGIIAFLGSVDTVIRGNDISGTTELAMSAAGRNTLIERNTVTDNGAGVFVSGQDTLVVRNRVDSNDGDGIAVSSGTQTRRTVLDGNIANGNGDDGIDVDTPVTTLVRNTANFNADLGIEAVAGVTDGGGNKASGNGNPAQCVGVTCR